MPEHPTVTWGRVTRSQATLVILLLASVGCARPRETSDVRDSRDARDTRVVDADRRAASVPVYTRAETASVFAPDIISTGDVFASSFTRDGRTVFFTKGTNDRSQLQIMRSTWRDDRWQTPERAPFSTGSRQMDPHVAPDGKHVYFTAPRRRDALATDPDGDLDTWVARLDTTDTQAERVTSLANSSDNEIYPSVTLNRTLFFGVRTRAGGATAPSEIRYLTPQIRTTPVVVTLGTEIANPSNPYITPDGRVLIVSATSKAGRGRADLFVVTRGGDGRWSTPRNLGVEVNTADVEFCPQLSPDSRYLFFSRVHFDGDRMTGNDIYVVPVSSVPVLRDALLQRP